MRLDSIIFISYPETNSIIQDFFLFPNHILGINKCENCCTSLTFYDVKTVCILFNIIQKSYNQIQVFHSYGARRN